MANRIITIRHPKISEWNEKGVSNKNIPYGSNSMGLVMAEKTRKLLMKEKLDAILCAPHLGAIDTAKIIKRGQSIDLYVVHFLADQNLNEYKNEELHELDKRVMAGFEEAISQNNNKTIAIIAGEYPIRSILSWIRDMSHEEKMATRIFESSVSDFDIHGFEKSTIKIRLFNSINHLN